MAPLRPKVQRRSFDFRDGSALEWSSEDFDVPARNQSFVLEDIGISERLNASIPKQYADLVDIAAAIHLADRDTLRSDRGRGWGRKISLKMPVREPDRWLASPIRNALFDLLQFSTQDDWQIEFVPRATLGRPSETQAHLALGDPAEPCDAFLYSGGLDSFAGLAAHCSSYPDRRILCVSAVGNSRQLQRQREQLVLLRSRLGAKLTHIPVQFHLKYAEQHRQERTRRSRGFLFLVIGSVAALLAGEAQLLLSENGIGAINLPQDGAQIGIDNSRSVHPVTLQLMSRLMTHVSGRPFAVHNQAVLKTKAEMCAHPAVLHSAQGIAKTFSCDGFPVRRTQFAQCGFCTSCVLRRFALESSGLSRFDSGDYGRDLTLDQPHLAHHLRGLRALNVQALQIEDALNASDPWKALTVQFPELRRASEAIDGNCDLAQIKTRLMRLYKRHVTELQAFSATELLKQSSLLVAA